jgi:hypothetical protein
MAMRIFPLAALAVLLMTAAEVQAACVSVTEDSAWNATQQKTTHTLCQQREISRTTNDMAVQARWQLEMGTFVARTELQLQQQRAAQMMLNRAQ